MQQSSKGNGMFHKPMRLIFCGLSITSSWGNGHATTYRSLIRELSQMGHKILFLEQDLPGFSDNRDLLDPPYCETHLYKSLEELKDRFTQEVRNADAVIVGSHVPCGIEIGEWVLSQANGLPIFYDLDTPLTLSRLSRGSVEYLAIKQIPRYPLYLSFSGGPILRTLEEIYGSPKARALYCSIDPSHYFPEPQFPKWDLGYLGNYSDDRQSTLEELLINPAKTWKEGRFVVAGPHYPQSIQWEENIERIQHLSPNQHRDFYNRQRFTLNATRRDMIHAGFSPSIRLFEAAACGTPIISDYWPGLEHFFELKTEILISQNRRETTQYLQQLPEEERLKIAKRAREKVITRHSSHRRAQELTLLIQETVEEIAVAQARSRTTPWSSNSLISGSLY